MITSLSFGLLLSSLVLPARLAAETTLTPAHPVQVWQTADFTIGGAPTAGNNYDPAQIRIDAEITTPAGGQFTQPAFWAVDYTSTRSGEVEVLAAKDQGSWRLRLRPTESGEYQVRLRSSRPGATDEALGTFRFTAQPAATAGRQGWVRVAADRRTFETTDGKPLRLVGENVCWANGAGTYFYEKYFADLQRTGQNVARLWMCPWWLDLEQSGAVTQYKQDAAWRLDRVFQLAEEHGIYLLLCLDYHGMLQVDNPHWSGSGNYWLKNPYQQEQGGPALKPNDFFTDPRAQEIYQKRLRYLVARYAANTHLLAWQFFNEIDNVYAPHLLQAPDVASWHAEMGRWLKAHDPYHHLVTTSLTGGSDRPEIWSRPEMDFAVYHSYEDPAPGSWLAQLADDFGTRYGKPVLVGEYGIDWRGWGGRQGDPHLRAQRQALWGSALSNAAGAALSWWWEEIDADGVYPIYEALTSVLHRGGVFEGTWRPARVSPAPGPAPATVGEPLPGETIYLGPVALSRVLRQQPRNEAALTGALSAKRASQSLSAYLHGPDDAGQNRPLRLDAWWTEGAFIRFAVSRVEGDADLAVRIDGREVLRKSIPQPAAGIPGRGVEVEFETTVPVPAGHHRVELENLSGKGLLLDSLHVQAIFVASFAGGWQYPVEVQALRQADRAVLYAVSPEAVFPAGATSYHLPLQAGGRISLLDWPDGRYAVTWYDPATGHALARENVVAAQGALDLACPTFEVDLAAIVEPENGRAP